MRILISAYACEPGKGSEPEVGLQAVAAAASQHEVWVLTRSNNVAVLEEYFAKLSTGNAPRIIGIDGPPWLAALKRRFGQIGIHMYYEYWQRQAARVARSMDRDFNFDLVHHVTFATYWTRTGVAQLSKPLLWGPVGGGANTPWRLLPVLGWKGLLRESVRVLARLAAGLRLEDRRAVRKALLTLVQNAETGARMRQHGSIRIFPNALAATSDAPLPTRDRIPEIVMVGRLTPYKAGVLAVDALARVADDSLRLVVIGEGPDRKRILRRARTQGVDGRLEFTGRLARDEVFKRMATATALIHPALHDDSPLTIAEALSMGTPVVCLDHGGPPIVCAAFEGVSSTAVSTQGSRATVARRLAEAVEIYRHTPSHLRGARGHPKREFRDVLLDCYQTVDALRNGDQSGETA